jgi:hypothetical protein
VTLLAKRRERQRTAVITYMRGNGWLFTTDMWRHLRIRSGALYVVLAELERDGLVESRWQDGEERTPDRPRRRIYRLRAVS